jgi:hypothetical protein
MASLDSLPADQKAVLSLVLQRGQSFDQIAALLFIDRAAVRQRALAALGALGPDTSVDPLKRGLITDYLLGQLPPAVADSVRDSLAANPPERAWARVVAAEVAPLAAKPLPDIPAAGATSASRPPATAASPAPAPGLGPDLEDEAGDDFFEDDELFSEPATGAGTGAAALTSGVSATAARGDQPGAGGGDGPTGPPPSSRRGGAVLLALIVLVVIVVVVVLLVTGGSKQKPKTKSARAPAVTSTTPGKAGTPGTSTTSTDVTPLHQINLISPTNTKGREGAADVVKAGGKLGLVIVAEGLSANAKNAYGVWLYDSKSGSGKFLGFYSLQVTSTGSTKGELEAEDALPSNAQSYNELLLTLETAEKPTKPGTIVLQGTFAE